MTVSIAESVVPLLSDLVGLESVNPSLVSSGSGEQAVASFMVDWLRRAGLEADLQMASAGRPNSVGRLAGSGGGRSLMLNAHLDTVGLGNMREPLTLRVEGDRAFGRGAYDMKGSLAAIMLAARELAVSDRLRGDVIIAGVADEEYASLGTQALLESVRTDGAVVTEPTDLKICVAHKGFAWVEMLTEGVAAHGSKPNLGVDAIGHMGDVLTELSALAEELVSRPAHPLLGHGSLHASLIEGGQELSSYPASCRLQIERRTLPGETARQIEAEIADVILRASSRRKGLQAKSSLFFWRDPFGADSESEIVTDLKRAAREVLGGEPPVVGETPWMDSAFTQAAGIPTVVFGPAGSGAHGDAEWVSLSSVARCAEVLVTLARDFCG